MNLFPSLLKLLAEFVCLFTLIVDGDFLWSAIQSGYWGVALVTLGFGIILGILLLCLF